MEAVIPETVLAQLRELNSTVPELDGGFTCRQLAEKLGVGEETARRRIRKMFRAGKLEARSFGLTTEQANELGYLGGCKLIVYYPTAA